MNKKKIAGRAWVFFAFFLLLLSGPSSGGQEKLINLGPKVNSPDSEFGPIVTASGNALYFTSDRQGGYGMQDIWVSRRVKGEWQEAQNLGPGINTKFSEGPDSFSLDERTMFFTRCDKLEQPGICDIYTARWDEKKKSWTDIKPLGPGVNSEYNDTNSSLSPDGNKLYFISDRPDEKGKRNWDIFVSEKQGDRWGPAHRLGPPVNSPGSEIHVIIHPDGTLYFSSDGYGGVGGFDIFFSKPQGKGFGAPKNMGEPINTSGNDIYFTIPASGDLAYLASNRPGGQGMEDIYAVPMDLVIPAKKTAGILIIKGMIADKDSCPRGKTAAEKPQGCKPLAGAQVKIRKVGEDKARFEKVIDQTGQFQATLPADDSYWLEVSAQGFNTVRKKISSTPGKPLVVFEENILMSREK